MAKSKNHTNNNQNYKAHRNGIQRPKNHKFGSLKGVDPKFLKNLRFAKANNKKSAKKARSLRNTEEDSAKQEDTWDNDNNMEGCSF